MRNHFQRVFDIKILSSLLLPVGSASSVRLDLSSSPTAFWVIPSHESSVRWDAVSEEALC